MQWLQCPECLDSLLLKVRKNAGEEIIEGSLSCQCGRSFPIIRGVPRFLPEELRHELPKYYPEFSDCNSIAVRVENFAKAAMDNIKSSTSSRFGYEWNYFCDYDCNNFETFTAPLPWIFLEGKLVLMSDVVPEGIQKPLVNLAQKWLPLTCRPQLTLPT